MKRTLIKDLRMAIGQTVKIQGWLQTLRDQKRMQFLIVRDVSGLAQVAFAKDSGPDLAEKISKLTPESALTITGRVVANPVVKLGQLEIQLETLEVNSLAGSPLPFDPFAETLPQLDYRLDWRYLDLRRAQNLLLFRVQTTALQAMREYWIKNQFIEIHTPKIMGVPSESGAELFTLEYFDRQAYLAQSPQFYKQMAMAAGFERVFEVGPVFRADPSFTSRHMTEFTGVDMEMSWIDSDEEVMAFQESWLAYVFERVKETHAPEIRTLFNCDLEVPSLPFPRVPITQALEIIQKGGYTLPPDIKTKGIDAGGERAIAAYVKETYRHNFVFLTEWPAAARPFYHMRPDDQPQLTCSFDLIGYGLELATGAQREHRLDRLTQQASEKGLSLEPLRFYADFFKYGCPPHGGFGFGLSRLMMIMLGIGNIREVVYLFRGPNRLSP